MKRLAAPPVFEEGAGGAGDAIVAAEAPFGDGVADVVDELVFLLAVFCPFRAEDELFFAALLTGGRDWDEVGGITAGFDELIGNASFAEVEMAHRFLERGIDDGIFDDDVGHGRVYSVMGWAVRCDVLRAEPEAS